MANPYLTNVGLAISTADVVRSLTRHGQKDPTDAEIRRAVETYCNMNAPVRRSDRVTIQLRVRYAFRGHAGGQS